MTIPPTTPDSTPSDPLGVLASTALVVRQAASVRIDQEAIERIADTLVRDQTQPPAWDDTLHYRDPQSDADGDARTAGWIMALDALNFCFWSQDHWNGSGPEHRWRVTWHGKTHDGYDALAASLSRAVEDGIPVWDPNWLANVSASSLHEIFRADPGSADIPLFSARLDHLHELGAGLQSIGGDAPDHQPVIALITRAAGSSVGLANEVVTRFPSFNDVSLWKDTETGSLQEIRFYKRAQILVADLHGSLADRPIGTFHDIDRLTAFADYKVPQVLRRLGALVYTPDLAERIGRRALLPVNSPEEIEIRAATIQACERIRLAMSRHAADTFTAMKIDWLLWNAGQSLPKGSEPYHRTRTIFY